MEYFFFLMELLYGPDQFSNFDTLLFRQSWLHTWNLHHCFYFTLPFKKRCPLKWAYKINDQFGEQLQMLYRHPLWGSPLFKRQGETKTIVQLTGVYNSPVYPKWQPFKVRRTVHLNWSPFWKGLSFRPLVYAILFL